MDRQLIGAVDRYVDETFGLDDEALSGALNAARAAGLPDIQIGAAQGRFLEIMARTLGARRILEIGTLGGYSTIWLARGLADGGKVVTLEIDPIRAGVASSNFRRAGVQDRVDVREGPALVSLANLAAEGGDPIDMAFIDADEANYVAYLDAVLGMARTGALIVADNVIRQGDVIDPATTNPRAQGARRFNDYVAQHPRLLATLIPIVGQNNIDGMVVALVVD